MHAVEVGTSQGMAPRLLLADDDDAFREQLAAIVRDLVPEGEIVAAVADGHAAVAAAMAHSPTVVLMDYSMPGPNGAHAASVIAQALPGVRIVILSGLEPTELEDLPGDVRIVRKGAGMERALAEALG